MESSAIHAELHANYTDAHDKVAMTNSIWLTPAEVEELTALKRWPAQCRALARMGIPFRPNGIGRPLVERAAVLQFPHGVPERKPRVEPNWDALPRRKPVSSK